MKKNKIKRIYIAIDFDIVAQGVKEKYGADFSEDKARAFFDKIIQVPFNLPISAYNVSEALKSWLAGPTISHGKFPNDTIDCNRYIRSHGSDLKITNFNPTVTEWVDTKTEDLYFNALKAWLKDLHNKYEQEKDQENN